VPLPNPQDADALKINMLLKDGLDHLSEIQRELIQSVFGVFGTERIKAFKRHFRLAHQLRSREVDEQLALAILAPPTLLESQEHSGFRHRL
jgi:hypothetical protein